MIGKAFLFALHSNNLHFRSSIQSGDHQHQYLHYNGMKCIRALSNIFGVCCTTKQASKTLATRYGGAKILGLPYFEEQKRGHISIYCCVQISP